MITRVWRGRATERTADAYVRHLETAVFPELEGLPGFRGAQILCKGVDFVVMTWWESLDSIHPFAGDDVERAVVPPEAQALLKEWDETVSHYEVVARREA